MNEKTDNFIEAFKNWKKNETQERERGFVDAYFKAKTLLPDEVTISVETWLKSRDPQKRTKSPPDMSADKKEITKAQMIESIEGLVAK